MFPVYLRNESGVGKMVQSVWGLPCTHQDWSSILRAHVKQSGAIAHACGLFAGEGKASLLTVLADLVNSRLVRDPVSKKDRVDGS